MLNINATISIYKEKQICFNRFIKYVGEYLGFILQITIGFPVEFYCIK